MNSDQLAVLTSMAKQGEQLAAMGNMQAGESARRIQDRLTGWQECAASAGDMDLSAAAVRGWIWISAATYHCAGLPMPLLEMEKLMMRGGAA